MPTKHPRHTVAETPRVEGVLRRLRARQPGRRIDYQELLVLGALEKLRRLESSDDQSALVESFLSMRDGDGVDAKVGLALHESGWIRSG